MSLDRTFVTLPGFLGTGAGQFGPLAHLLDGHGEARHYDYALLNRQLQKAAQEVAAEWRDMLLCGHQLYGLFASYGAQFGGNVLRILRDDPDWERLSRGFERIVLVDGVAGGQYLKQVPRATLPLFNGFLRIYNPEKINSRIERFVEGKFCTPLREDEIIPPRESELIRLVTRDVESTATGYVEWALKTAFVDKSKAPGWLILRQLKEMAGAPVDFQAYEGLSMAYIACVGSDTCSNVVLRQPEAAEAWKREFGSISVCTVRTGHVTFREDPVAWSEALPAILDF